MREGGGIVKIVATASHAKECRTRTCLVPIGALMTAIAIILTLSGVALGILIMWLLWMIVSASNGSPTGNGNS